MGSDIATLKPLEEVVKIYDSQRKPVTKSDRKPGPYPYYGASGITDYVESYIFDGEYILLAEDGDNLRTRNKPIAFIAKGKFWVNNHAHIIQANEFNHTRFLNYALQVADVDSFISGSTRPKITQGDMKHIKVYSPPLPEQKNIAHILGSLDDKIELNRKMNETLEAMAQALFKSWFVDFDPVIDNALEAGNEIPDELMDRAEVRKVLRPSPPAPLPEKGEGSKSYGVLPDEVKCLFPSEFEFSDEMDRWVPLGWKADGIGNIVKVLGGGTPSTKNNEYWDNGDIYWTTPKDLSGLNSPVLLDTARKITEKGLSKISSGLLPQKTFLMSSRAPVGYLAISQIPIAINQGYIAIPPFEKLSSEFLINWAHFNMDTIKSRAGGTTFAEISKQNFKSILIILPNENIMRSFSDKASLFYKKITENEKQQTILKEQRDSLLPKLLSGKISIPDFVFQDLTNE